MTVNNPYKMRGMLPIESGMFFGREREMRRIKDMLTGDSPQCVSIIGERRIGKSSLTFRVFHKMINSEDTIAIYLDCDGLSEKCKTKDQFFQLLNRSFLETKGNVAKLKRLLEKGEEELFDTYPAFKAFLKRAAGELTHKQLDHIGVDAIFENIKAIYPAFSGKEAMEALGKLVSKEILFERNMRYRFPVNLQRKWIAARYPLRKVREEI